MSGGDWKDLYQAAVEGNLALLRYHFKEGTWGRSEPGLRIG
jgi:hypothetical protein